MSEQEHTENPFSVEQFRGRIIDIVHIESVRRVAEGEKPADISDRRQAIAVLRRIQKLQEAGVQIRYIENLNAFIQPDGFQTNQDELIVGGAFLNQCIKAYTDLLDKLGIRYTINPLLTVRGHI